MVKIEPGFSTQHIWKLANKNRELVLGKFICDDEELKKAAFEQLFESFGKLATDPSILRFALTQGKSVTGVLALQRSSWDSEHFGMGIGKSKVVLFCPEVPLAPRRLLIREALGRAKTCGLQEIFIRTNLNDMQTLHAIEAEGGFITDILLTFQWSLGRAFSGNFKIRGVDVVEADENDAELLSKIARDVFRMDHFHGDPLLPQDKCHEVYAKWTRSCLSGLSDVVLAAKRKSEILGYVTCKIEQLGSRLGYGVIDLIGVARAHLNKGVGSLLLSEALNWFANRTCSVYVGTQATNIQALRLYEKFGFRSVLSEATSHFYISLSTPS